MIPVAAALAAFSLVAQAMLGSALTFVALKAELLLAGDAAFRTAQLGCSTRSSWWLHQGVVVFASIVVGVMFWLVTAQRRPLR